MPNKKRCMYSLCANNNDRPNPRIKFTPFPRPRKEFDKCKEWINACGRFDNQLDINKIAKKSYYMCNEHFVGGNGPTSENPNPIPFQETTETLNLMSQSWPSEFLGQVEEVIRIDTDEICDSANHTNHILNSTMIIDSSNQIKGDHFENPEAVANESLCQNISIIEVDNIAFSNQACASQSIAGKIIPKNWILTNTEDGIALTIQNIEKGLITKSYFLKDYDKRGTLKIHGKVITEDHPLVKLLPDITCVDALLKVIEAVNSFPLCTGIIEEKFLKHFETKEKTFGYKNLFDDALHSISCEIVLSRPKIQNVINLQTKDLSDSCTKYRKVLMNSMRRQSKRTLSKCGETRIKYLPRNELAKKLKTQTQRGKDLRKKINKIKSKIRKDSKNDGQFLHDADSKFVIDQLEQQKHLLPKNSIKGLFVEQQLAIMKTKNKRQRRWHPKIIQWAIHLYKKSSSAYNAIVSSGMFELPSKRTLYNHSSHVGLNSGFTNECLVQATEMLYKACPEEHQQYVSVIIDEMKIREDIICRASTGELVGFSNLDATGNEILKLRIQNDDLPEVATHVLQIMIRSITGNFKFPLAYFPCNNMNTDGLHRIVSEAISKLEFYGIKVLSVIGDGASTNRKMFHNFVQDVFFWKNIYACDEDRYVYFICDPPHLLKTTRNGFSNSNFHTMTKNLIKDGKKIQWTHVLRLYELDIQRTVKLVPKLTKDHVMLDSHSRMRVYLAAQVLSGTVANALELEFGDECQETVRLIRLMNKFFDCMNSRNLKEGVFGRNPNVLPFFNKDDERLEWLEGPFLHYFSEWEREVDRLPKSVSAADKKKMILSRETIEGLRMTAKSVPAIVRFLLKKKAKFILTNHLNQDCLEQEFGKQRGSCGGNTNPDVLHFAQNVDRFKNLDGIVKAPQTGNTQVKN